MLSWDIIISSLTFLGWAAHYFLPFDLCHVIKTFDPMDPKADKIQSRVQDMFKSFPSIDTLIFYSLYHPKSLHPFVLCQRCGIHHDTPLTMSLPVDLNSLSRKFAEKLLPVH